MMTTSAVSIIRTRPRDAADALGGERNTQPRPVGNREPPALNVPLRSVVDEVEVLGHAVRVELLDQ
jgi:hypothetical protein